MMEQMAKKILLRKEILGEYKEIAPKHEKGEYLAKPNREEMKEREVTKETRKKELKEVEKALRDKQVKFLTTEDELDEIKKSAQLNRKTLSEFIRSAIWEKIGSLELKEIIPLQKANAQEEALLEILKDIKERLKDISRLEKKALKRISGLEIPARF
ncbi:unnamed protein product [marine sediment metagenome]|uniref:Uncharacterized protein n=1 Tax=marine sediment metagenome TaxID=412755 RepID=X0YXW4_9ZZZZ